MVIRIGSFLLAAFALALPAAGAAQNPATPAGKTLLPVDEARNDPSWLAFRNRLLDAVARRDRKLLLSVVDRNIRNGLGAPAGAAEFRKQWALDADAAPLWRDLSAALFLGSAWLQSETGPRQLCAPYVAVKWPEDVDPFEHGAITARDVLVKARPTSASSTLATLSYDIVPVLDWEVADSDSGTKQRWVRIHAGSQEGYVPEEQIRSPIEHRACFVKSERGWRMVAFVIGVER